MGWQLSEVVSPAAPWCTAPSTMNVCIVVPHHTDMTFVGMHGIWRSSVFYECDLKGQYGQETSWIC